jgi:hypothetical protein
MITLLAAYVLIFPAFPRLRKAIPEKYSNGWAAVRKERVK